MIKYSIDYRNVFGEDATETLYFNLTQAEILELEFKYKDVGGMSARMKRLGEEDTTPREISELFRELISVSYGERVGNKFVKPNADDLRTFLASEAFSTIYTRLVGFGEDGESENPFEFLVGIFPDIVGKNVDLTDLNQQYEAMKAERRGEAPNPEMSAREKSQAQMKGFNKKKDPNEKKTAFPTTDELEVDPSPEVITDLDRALNEERARADKMARFEAWEASQNQS